MALDPVLRPRGPARTASGVRPAPRLAVRLAGAARMMMQPGDRLGEYEVMEHVTSGGMASLYRARRSGARGFAKEVAIKVVHERLSDQEDFQRMFIDEAILSSRLSHPNIVHVEEFGESDRSLYLVMEFVDGCSLSDLLRHLRKNGRVLSVPHAVRIASEVAAALHAAHEALDEDGSPLAVVHRDVSPGNVLLSRAGHVKMIDFGIASSRMQGAESVSGNFKGKFRYMSPEQAHGYHLDRRSDIYSLGLVLWELLAGRPALRATTDLGILELARDPSIPPPSLYRETVVPLELDEVVLEALERERDDRPDTAIEFRRRLVAACPESLQVEAETLGQLVKTVPDKRRRRLTPSPANASHSVLHSTHTLPPKARTSSLPPLGSSSSGFPLPNPAESHSSGFAQPWPPRAPQPERAPPPPVVRAVAGGGAPQPAPPRPLYRVEDVQVAEDAPVEEDDYPTIAQPFLEGLPDLSEGEEEDREDATVADPSIEETFARLVADAEEAESSISVPVMAAANPVASPQPAPYSMSTHSTAPAMPSRRPTYPTTVIYRPRRWVRFVVPLVAAGIAAFVGTAVALVASRDTIPAAVPAESSSPPSAPSTPSPDPAEPESESEGEPLSVAEEGRQPPEEGEGGDDEPERRP